MLLQVTLLQLTLLSIVCRASDEWVVKIPDGQADLVAKLHQLENLGEAVPESGYFHFRQNSEISRKKRSLRELTDEFEANPLVESYEAQLQSLRLV